MRPSPGEVCIVDLGIGGKVRPMLVVSREDPDPPRALAICVPVTTKNRGSRYEIKLPRLPFLREQSYVNVQGIMAVQHHELGRTVGKLSAATLEDVKVALRFAMNL